MENTNRYYMNYKGRTGEAALAFFIGELPETVAWATGKTLLSVNLKKQPDQWLLIITVEGAKGREVAFLGGDGILECYRLLYQYLRNGRLPLKRSKY